VETLPATAQLASSGGAPEVPPLTPAEPTTADSVTTVDAGPLSLRIARELALSGVVLGEPALTGTWAGQDVPVQLATLG
jgi:hypothetical protein